MKRTYHFEQRLAQRGITYAMVRFTLDNGVVDGDKFFTTKKMVREMVNSLNIRITKLRRLRKKFKQFSVSRLVNKAIDRLIAQKTIALRIIAKGGIVIIVDNASLITAYGVDSYKKY